VGAHEPHDLLLEYELSLFDTEFVIAYTVTNRRDASIWLTTPLTRVGDEGQVVADAQKVYAYVDPDGVLHVTKRVWPVPDDLDVYEPERPLLTEVRAGSAFAETLRLAVPVQVGVGYAWASPTWQKRSKGSVGIEAIRFAFSIDVFTVPLWGPDARTPVQAEDAAPVRLQGDEVDLVVSVVDDGS